MKSNPLRPPRKITSRKELQALQRLMTVALFRPLTARDRTSPKWKDGRTTASVVQGFIKPNDRLTALERLEIYHRQYWFRLRDCFYEDFPGVRSILGEKRFAVLAGAYLAETPSRSYTLRNLGSRLASWMRRHPEYLGAERDVALDMARLEWAHIETFDSEAKTPLPLEALAAKSPARLRLKLQPHVRLLNLGFPVDDWLIEAKSGGAGEQRASNAVREPKPRARLRTSGHLVRERVFVAAHRFDGSVYYKRLDREAFRLLRHLQQGSTLSQAAAAVFRRSPLPVVQQAERLQQWFSNWAALGWFCD